MLNEIFIALIHPIQWTIAFPVGADRPTKQQKSHSVCMHTGRRALVCTRQVSPLVLASWPVPVTS